MAQSKNKEISKGKKKRDGRGEYLTGLYVVKMDPQEANTDANDTVEGAEEDVCDQ